MGTAIQSKEADNDFYRAVAGYFLPPLGVYMQVGLTSAFWINLILSFFGFFPGVIHAAWVIATVGENGSTQPNGSTRFIGLLLAPFAPFISVLLARGFGTDLLISIVLSLFFWIPGIIHAAYVVTHTE